MLQYYINELNKELNENFEIVSSHPRIFDLKRKSEKNEILSRVSANDIRMYLSGYRDAMRRQK